MKLKKWTALALSAALATCMLTGCPWEENEENSDDASSTPGTSQGGGHSGPDDSEKYKKNTTQPLSMLQLETSLGIIPHGKPKRHG